MNPITIFANKMLGLDNTEIPRTQLNAISEILSKYNFNTNTTDLKKLLKVLKKKHLVDLICIATKSGSVVASTANGNGLKEAIIGTAMFNYIKSEIPKSETVLIKSDDWYMLMPYKNKVFIVRAPASLSTIEFHALAKEVEDKLSKGKSF
ncbi:hypothetical protein KKG83_02690 [Candidatus Micrarchaeota archaeon]|nr:hypothetical protein [Candidatus Micrarchaeota archaeon]MBU2476354.1 hypothetical protein [Candidatus Micrarchaeota archaeon]